MTSLIVLAIVFTIGAPSADLEHRLGYEGLFAIGGALYIPVALGLTRLLDPSGRRLTLHRGHQGIRRLLACVADFYGAAEKYDGALHQGRRAAGGIGRPLAGGARPDHQLPDPTESERFFAAIVMLLEAFDGIVSTHADHAPARLGAADGDLAPLVADLVLRLAGDLDGRRST